MPGLELQRSEIPRHIPNGYTEASPPAARPRTAPKGSANRTSCCSPSKWCTNLPQFQKEQGKEGIFWLEGHNEMTEASNTRTAASYNSTIQLMSSFFYCSLRGFGSSFISTAPLLPFIRSLLHHYGILTACALMKETRHGQGLLLLSHRRQQPRYTIIPFVGEKNETQVGKMRASERRQKIKSRDCVMLLKRAREGGLGAVLGLALVVPPAHPPVLPESLPSQNITGALARGACTALQLKFKEKKYKLYVARLVRAVPKQHGSLK